MLLAGVLLSPALALLWSLCGKFTTPVPPEPIALSLTWLGALAFNLSCALLLARFRHHSGSLTCAAFLSAGIDAVAIIGAGLVTANLWNYGWPDVLVGLAIAATNIDTAREVWDAAHEEHAIAKALAAAFGIGAVSPKRQYWDRQLPGRKAPHCGHSTCLNEFPKADMDIFVQRQ
ncbi:cation transporter [Devosia sp. PTR5]|uniref:Cation transporter n=1 Tax=Devosia oryzisoli TaxID=2774138 RepID=A0A927ISW4_9HYPH|nr:cation transporter [Devosia oryzisoli]